MIDKFDVLSEIAKYGITITDRTLLRWERGGLIPEATRTYLGRGEGIRSEYPAQTPAEAVATSRMLHGDAFRISPKRLAEIRKLALKIEPYGGIAGPEIADAFYDYDRQKQIDLGMAQDWLAAKHMVLHSDKTRCEVCKNLFPPEV